MYNLSGIIYRLWGVCGIIFLIGVLAFLVSGIGTKSVNKQCLQGGVLCTIVALGLAIHYGRCVIDPSVAVFQGTFAEEQRNSRVAPPLPFTMEYSFYDENGTIDSFYLDVLSKKDIHPEGFTVDREYLIYYETRTDIIVRVEEIYP